MASAKALLTQRIRDIRRRHFGARGKAEFARRLGVPVEEYERFERNVVPPGDILLRICELTGEDMQWLLTGVAARGTVVISGARGRHQHLITRIAEQLEADPSLAAPLEAFFDLLTAGPAGTRGAAGALSTPVDPADAGTLLMPILAPEQIPDELPDPDRPSSIGAAALPTPESVRVDGYLSEPAVAYDPDDTQPIQIIESRDACGHRRKFFCGGSVGVCFPGAFGVLIGDDSMRPMFEPGDAAIVSAGTEPVVGRPAICRVADEPHVRCRIWLGIDSEGIHLGRLGDAGQETIAPDRCRWALEALYRISTRN